MFMRKMIWDELEQLDPQVKSKKPKLLFPEHHLSHAASAFYPSPFKDAAILTVDGVGEWATTTIGAGRGNQIEILQELPFPHSLGLLYSAFTYYCGFKVNSGEYKLMGLAPYGKHESQQVQKFEILTKQELVDIKEDGSIILNMDYFDYATGLRMCKDEKWQELFGLPRREQESEISQAYMDMALAIQNITEDIILKLASTCVKLTGLRNLVMLSMSSGFNQQPAMPAVHWGRPWLHAISGREKNEKSTPLVPTPCRGPISALSSAPSIFSACVAPTMLLTCHTTTFHFSVGKSPDCWNKARWSAGSRAAWNTALALSATAAFSATLATRRCRKSST
jgi:hypothetical protein